ncbi:MAG: VOC family protein [Actinobacteria bacterium]|jgi:predicted enzyme related to lactoylglutathione lyase|nr:MAG: VOC family protein [Actinomycetota bacterium]
MPRVVHFDVDSDDPQRAIGFYAGVFGWKFDKWEGPMEYWLITTGPDGEAGINGGMGIRSEGGLSFNTYRCTIEVPDADEYAAKVRENGGQTLMDKMAIPGVGWFVPCVDSEGNHFGLMQSDDSAR